jgi:hypothetical protein
MIQDDVRKRFESDAGPFDPPRVTCTLFDRRPGDEAPVLVYGEDPRIVRDGIGEYHLELDTPVRSVRWEAGDVIAQTDAAPAPALATNTPGPGEFIEGETVRLSACFERGGGPVVPDVVTCAVRTASGRKTYDAASGVARDPAGDARNAYFLDIIAAVSDRTQPRETVFCRWEARCDTVVAVSERQFDVLRSRVLA